ncbi:MAG: 30S ribosomal protein S15 [Candidatus Diapherotrites archaeon]|nr:30S ribosomal protein S15 [Candidatus Diapherotrites archaeon]
MAESKEKKYGWVEYKPEEIEDIIYKLYHEGKKKSDIGAIMRDQYGIPNVKEITGKTVSEILIERGVKEEVPEDLMSLIKKSVKLLEHMEKHKKDFKAKRGYEVTTSKIRRLVGYYKEKGTLPENWEYTPEKAKLLVK